MYHRKSPHFFCSHDWFFSTRVMKPNPTNHNQHHTYRNNIYHRKPSPFFRSHDWFFSAEGTRVMKPNPTTHTLVWTLYNTRRSMLWPTQQRVRRRSDQLNLRSLSQVSLPTYEAKLCLIEGDAIGYCCKLFSISADVDEVLLVRIAIDSWCFVKCVQAWHGTCIFLKPAHDNTRGTTPRVVVGSESMFS